MSTSTLGSTPAAPTSVQLPAGVTVGAFRETSSTNAQGQVVQGVVFPLTLPNGGTTTVFVPYTVLGNVSQVQQMFLDRINALTAITG